MNFVNLTLTALIAAAVTALLAAAQGVADPPGFRMGVASPGRQVGMYLANAAPEYSPNRLPRAIYVFRTSASLDGGRVADQPDVLADGSDIRQFVVVVVPDGTLPAPLLTEDDVLASSWEKITVGGIYCLCPLVPENFTYASPLDEALYPQRSAVLANGTATAYLDFGTTPSFDAGNLYEMVRAGAPGQHLGVLIDTVPGDNDFHPMRKVFRVSLEEPARSVDELNAAPLVDTGRYVVAAVVFVRGADAVPEVFSPRTGFSAGRTVTFYEFNSTRVASGMYSSTSISPARLYIVEGYSTPVVDVVPGDATYSDLWSVFDVPASAVAQLPPRSVDAFDTAQARYRGEYLNCPIVHPNATLAVSPVEIPKQELFYRNELRYCFRFPEAPALSCQLIDVFELRRSGSDTRVEGNDLFSVAPSNALRYTPMSWVLPLPVAHQFARGSATRVEDFPGRTDTPRASGVLSNRPIVSEGIDDSDEAPPPPIQYGNREELSTQHFRRVLLEWNLNPESLDVRMTASFSSGFVALGFGGVLGSAHTGFFVSGQMSDGATCIRQFVGSAAAPTSLEEVTTLNPLNVTNARFRLTKDSAVLSFTRSVVTPNVVAPPGIVLDNASLVVNEASRVAFVVMRTEVPTCFTNPQSIAHDGAAGEKLVLWNSELIAPPTLTPAPITFWPPPALSPTDEPTSMPPGEKGKAGSYRCDATMSFSWTISEDEKEIEFLITPREGFSGWVSIGIGSRMIGADIYTLFRYQHSGQIVIDDRKGIAYELPPRDISQDAFLVGDTEFRFRRKLDTLDRNTGAQPLPRATLVSRSYIHRTGWANGARVAYFDFRNEPSFGWANVTTVATMYVMRNATGGSLRFQRDVVDVVPGQPGYSDLWDVIDVQVPADFVGPEIRSIRDIPTSWQTTETGQRLNCPVIHSFSTLDLRNVGTALRELWYRGSLQQCVAFGAENAQSRQTQNVYFMVSGQTNETVDAVFQYSPVNPQFSAFCWVHHVVVPSSYTPGSYTSETQVLASPFNVTVQNTHINLPMVSLSDVTDPITTQTPAPPVLDSGLFDQYEHMETLYSDAAGVERVTLHWNYMSSRRVLQVMVVGYSINGYVAVGFSNATSRQMENADIVLGYVNSRSQEGCVRTLYSAFSTGAPSAPPTMQIRLPSVQASAGAVILRFERDFDARAHFAGQIPTPAQGATSRVIFATLRGYIDEPCNSTTYSALYHGSSPHGSQEIRWMESSNPVTPPPTPSPPFVLRQETLVPRSFYFRRVDIAGYCVGEDIHPSALAAGPPTMLRFVNDTGNNTLLQQPLVDAFPRSSAQYSGIWEIRTVLAPQNVSFPVTSMEQLRFPNGTWRVLEETAARYHLSCPIVHPQTTVQPQDVAEFPTEQLFYRGDVIGCINLGRVAPNSSNPGQPRAFPIWNVTRDTTSLPIVDELSGRLWQVVNVQSTTSTTLYNAAEVVASLVQSPSGVYRTCSMLAVQPGLIGSPATPPARTYSQQRGFFGGREVSFLKVESPQARFASRGTVWTNMMYLLRVGGLAIDSPAAQPEPIVDVAPGNLTYSDIWRVVVVDVGTVPSAAHMSRVSIENLPHNVTDIYFNCPVINPATVFVDIAIARLTLYYRGQNMTCANFGFVPPPPSELPEVFEVRRPSGVIATNDVFAAVPGVAQFYPVQWVVVAQVLTDATSGITSIGALESITGRQFEAYTAWNIFIASVSTGVRAQVLGTVTAVGDPPAIIRLDSLALMVSPVMHNLSTEPRARLPPLPLMYVFRRGMSIDSEEIETQRPIIDVAPGEIGYTAVTGSSGYSDTFVVHVVQVPRNFTGAEVRSATALTSALGPGWAVNSSTGIFAHAFVNVNTTAGDQQVNCPTATIWLRNLGLPSLHCGFSPARTTATSSATVSEVHATVAASDALGLSLQTVVPLSERNPYIVNAFRPTQIDGWVDNRSVTAFRLSHPAPPPPLSSKYVFRAGPSLFTGGGVEALLPVLDTTASVGQPVTAHLHVVDISGTSSSEIPERISGVAELLRVAEQRCWPIHPTGVVEIGVLLAMQTSIPLIDGVAMSTVTRDGTRFRHLVASRLGMDELGILSHAVVIIAQPNSSSSVDRFVFTNRQSVLWNAFVRVWEMRHRENAQAIRSAPAASEVNVTTDVMIIHATRVSPRPHVPELVARAYVRSEAWFESRKVFFYNFDDREIVGDTAANRPTPVYMFRTVDEGGAAIGTVGQQLIVALPGHEDYNDVHAVHQCDVPRTNTGLLPHSEQELERAISRGDVLRCVFTGLTRLMVVVHTESTLEPRDLFDPSINPGGVTLQPVVFENTELLAFDFGPVDTPFERAVSQAMLVRRDDGTWMQPNTAVSRIPGVPGYTPLKATYVATMPPNYLLNSLRNISDIVVQAASIAPGPIHTMPVVSVDSETPAMLLDDLPISVNEMPVIWAYGPLGSDPVELLQHEARGAATINFFTGETDQQEPARATQTAARRIQFGTVFSMTWEFERHPVAPRPQPGQQLQQQRRRFAPSETVTFAPHEVDIVVTIRCRVEGWAAIGLSRSGGMLDSDIMLTYLTEFAPPGEATLQTYFHLSDRHSTNEYALPPADEQQDLRIISYRMLDDLGYEVVFARKLVTGDSDDMDIVDDNMTLIWAHGPFDRTRGIPRRHTSQGTLNVNLISGAYVKVPQRRDSFWYIAILVAMACLTMLLSMTFRLLPPGKVLWRRLLKFKSSDTLGWLTEMPIGEHCILVIVCAMSAVWMVGKLQDMEANRLPNAAWRCIGAGVQFFMYFYVIPILRYNVVLDIFRTFFHRMVHWVNIIGWLMVLLAWFHGIGMMIVSSTRAFEWHGIAAIIGTAAMTALVAVTSNAIPLPRRSKHILFIVLVLVTIIFVCIHAPSTAFGLIPSFLLMLYDFAMRFKDRNSRIARVRSHEAYGNTMLAMELEVYSPWHRCRTRPFTAQPGQFIYVHFAACPHPIALMLSSRVLQDMESDWATVTVHLKAGKRSSLARTLLNDAKVGRLEKRGATIEGPFGGLQLRLRYYHTLVMVAGGIGMSSVMAVLEQLTFDAEYFSRETQLQHVTVIWVVRDAEDLLLFATELYEILRTPRPFELDLQLFATALNRNPLPTFHDGDSESAALPQKYASATADLPDHPLFSKQPVQRGRPIFAKVLADQKLAIAKRLEFRAAVYISAPDSLAADAAEVCAELSNWKEFQFHVEKETYQLR